MRCRESRDFSAHSEDVGSPATTLDSSKDIQLSFNFYFCGKVLLEIRGFL